MDQYFYCTNSFQTPVTCLLLYPLLLQAVAIVFGFLILICLIIIMVFAILTRKKINTFGKGNILWRKNKPVEDPNSPPDVEDWVNVFIFIFNHTCNSTFAEKMHLDFNKMGMFHYIFGFVNCHF